MHSEPSSVVKSDVNVQKHYHYVRRRKRQTAQEMRLDLEAANLSAAVPLAVCSGAPKAGTTSSGAVCPEEVTVAGLLEVEQELEEAGESDASAEELNRTAILSESSVGEVRELRFPWRPTPRGFRRIQAVHTNNSVIVDLVRLVVLCPVKAAPLRRSEAHRLA